MSKTVFNHTAHKAMWNWLAENPGRRRENWPNYEGIECYACEYENTITNVYAEICTYCPFGDFSPTRCLGGLYRDWYAATANKQLGEASKIAETIANLPLRTDMDIEVI